MLNISSCIVQTSVRTPFTHIKELLAFLVLVCFCSECPVQLLTKYIKALDQYSEISVILTVDSLADFIFHVLHVRRSSQTALSVVA